LSLISVHNNHLIVAEEAKSVYCFLVAPLPQCSAFAVDVDKFFLVKKVSGDDHEVVVMGSGAQLEDLGVCPIEADGRNGAVD